MIYVDKAQLDQVEYLLGQAAQGNHVLFEPELLRKAFVRREPLSVEDAYAVEPHIEKLIALPSLPQKRAYLEKLDPRTLEHVILAYFNILENTLYESDSVRH